MIEITRKDVSPELWEKLLKQCHLTERSPMDKAFEKGTMVYSRDAKSRGRTTGSKRPCRLEGCTGLRLGVKWNDGKITYPFTKGMTWRKRSWRIQ